MIPACKMQFLIVIVISFSGNALAQGSFESLESSDASADISQDIQDLQSNTSERDLVPELQGWNTLSLGGSSESQNANSQAGSMGNLGGHPLTRKNAMIPGTESFQPQYLAKPYVAATPSSGEAPLIVTLQVIGMEQTPFWLWELDWDGNGDMDTGGQGQPIVQVTYDQPGSYAPVFTFFDDRNQVIARAQGFLTATGSALPKPMDVLLPAGKINANPSEGYAPLKVILDATSIAPSYYYAWSLDQYSGGVLSYPGGAPVAQVVYENPGLFNATIVFYNSQLKEIARGRATILVHGATGSESQISNKTNGSGTGETGSSSAALTATPSGWGIFGGTSSSGQSRPPIEMGDGSDSWTAPKEEFTEDLKPELQVSPDKGSIPFTVRFDASGTYARNGVRSYSFDIAWGPDDAKGDGYYLSDSSNPFWSYTFKDYGMYLAILDVIDNNGNSARVTKVIFAYIGPEATLSANTTSGPAPLTVKFMALPVIKSGGQKAAYAYWDFDIGDAEPPVGGSLDDYGSVTHTYNNSGEYEAGLTLMDDYRNEGPMEKKRILVT
jgi:PKD repeat protein